MCGDVEALVPGDEKGAVSGGDGEEILVCAVALGLREPELRGDERVGETVGRRPHPSTRTDNTSTLLGQPKSQIIYHPQMK